MRKMIRKSISLTLVMAVLLGVLCMGAGAANVGMSGQDAPWNGGSTPSTGSTPTYTVTVKDDGNGTSESNRNTASAGSTVSITVTPGEGGELTSIVATDKNGDTIKLTKASDTTYTFTMPASNVTVSVVYEGGNMLITDDHFAYINGYGDGGFHPDGSLTRAEAATIFYRLLIDKTYTESLHFTDVKSGDWYYTAVMALAAKGILNGYGDGSFLPSGTVTRAEFCAMAARFFALSDGSVKFTDVTSTHWAYKYIASAVTKGWLADSATAYSPNGAISRKEVVSIVNKMLGRTADESYVDKNLTSLVSFADVAANASYYYDVMEAANGHNFELNTDASETWTSLK